MSNYSLYVRGRCNNCSPNKEGSWAYILLNEKGDVIKEASQGVCDTTVNRMEMQAMIKGVRRTPKGSEILIISDSEYAINIMSGKWKAQANIDLLAPFKRLKKDRHIKFEWAKANNAKYNSLCDKMTRQSIADIKKESKVPSVQIPVCNVSQQPSISKQYFLYAAISYENKTSIHFCSWAYRIYDEEGDVVYEDAEKLKGICINKLYMAAIIEGCKKIPSGSKVTIMYSDKCHVVDFLSGRYNTEVYKTLVDIFVQSRCRLTISYKSISNIDANFKLKECVELAREVMLKPGLPCVEIITLRNDTKTGHKPTWKRKAEVV